MKIVYIAHPIGGNVKENLSDLRRIVRKVNLEYPNVVPLVPYYADCVSLHDHIPEERERGIRNDKAIIESGVIDEMWLTGERLSLGMSAEAKLAKKYSIPIVDLIKQL